MVSESTLRTPLNGDTLSPVKTLSPGKITRYRVFEQIKDPDGKMKYAFLSNEMPKLNVGTSGVVSGEMEQYYPLQKIVWPICQDLETGHGEYLEKMYREFDKTCLWQEIRLFILDHLDLPDDRLYSVITSWIFCTWIWEDIPVVPYLFFYGTKNSGKTRGLEILKELCYRGILGSTVSTAALYRIIQKFHPTILLDEADSWTREKRQEIIGILNSGYRKGSLAIRCATGKNTENEVQYFDVFGFKAIAGTEGLKETLESRCIIIPMMTNRRPVKLFIDKEKANSLRTRLLMWRLIHFQKRKGDISDVSDVNSGGMAALTEEEVPGVLRETNNSRIIELFFFLYKYADEIDRKSLLEYSIEEGKKQSILEQISNEAEVLQILVDLSLELQNKFIATKLITDRFNAVREKNDWWRSRSIGRIVRRLGFPSKRTNKIRGIELEEIRLRRQCTRYSIDYKQSSYTPKETSLTSLMSPFDGQGEKT